MLVLLVRSPTMRIASALFRDAVPLTRGTHEIRSLCRPALRACDLWFTSDRRAFSTDGPFRKIKPIKFIEKKKHFNEVLIHGDRRKLLETAQDVLNEPGKTFPTAFWDIMAKRCVKSMHLFDPYEMAIIVRAFDVHSPRVRPDIYGAVAACLRTAKIGSFSGPAAFVLADVLSRRLEGPRAEVEQILRFIGRRASEVLYQLPAKHAVSVLLSMATVGAKDPLLCTRVAAKVSACLDASIAVGSDAVTFHLEDIASVADALAAQGHRDVQLLRTLASRVEEDAAEPAQRGGDDHLATVAQRVASAFAVLEVEGVPDGLTKLASAAVE